MIKKIATGISALALIAALASCSSEEELRKLTLMDLPFLQLVKRFEKQAGEWMKCEGLRITKNRLIVPTVNAKWRSHGSQ